MKEYDHPNIPKTDQTDFISLFSWVDIRKVKVYRVGEERQERGR